MNKEKVFKTAAKVSFILFIVCVFAFVAFLVASQIVWTPGTPSPLSQKLILAGATCLPLSFLFCMLGSEFDEIGNKYEYQRRRANLIKL